MNETILLPHINLSSLFSGITQQNTISSHHSDKIFGIGYTTLSGIVCSSYNDVYICIRHTFNPKPIYFSYASGFKTIYTDLFFLGF